MINIVLIIMVYVFLQSTGFGLLFWVLLAADGAYWLWKYNNAKKLQQRMSELGTELGKNIQESVKASVKQGLYEMQRPSTSIIRNCDAGKMERKQ